MRIQFCEFNEDFFRLSGIWLRDREVQELTMTPEIDEAERIAWYQSLPFRKDYFVEGIMADETPIGVIGFKNINREEGMAEYFGYIGNKEYWGGIGSLMMAHMREMALSMFLKLLYLKVTETNLRAYRLYKKHGYVEMTRLNGICIMIQFCT